MALMRRHYRVLQWKPVDTGETISPTTGGWAEVGKRDDAEKVARGLVELLCRGPRDLARELRVSYGAVYAWSVGRRRPKPEHALRLAELAERRARCLSESAKRLKRLARKSVARS